MVGQSFGQNAAGYVFSRGWSQLALKDLIGLKGDECAKNAIGYVQIWVLLNKTYPADIKTIVSLKKNYKT